MDKKEKSLDERIEDNFKTRDLLDKEYWSNVEKLNNEYDALMKELEDR